MSLINDALKRASQAQPPPPTSSEAGAPLQPVLYAPPSRLPTVILPMLFMAVLTLGIWFLVKGWEVARQLHPGTPITVAARKLPTSETNAVAAGPVQTEPVTPATVAGGLTVSPAPTSGLVTSVDSPPSTAPAIPPLLAAATPSPPATFPDLKLQAIFYRPSKPEVVISGKTLKTGDSISGVKIRSISQNAVVLEWNGQTREVPLD